MTRFEKLIVFSGQRARVACDGLCGKAWGSNTRPRVALSAEPDDFAWLADGELGEAPADPGTSEGYDAKPVSVTGPDDINRWCVRECERMVMSWPGESDRPLMLRDFSQRVSNKEASSGDAFVATFLAEPLKAR